MSEIKTQSAQQPVAHTQPKALRVLANIVSYVCHPVFMPVVMSVMVYLLARDKFQGITQHQLFFWLISIGVSTLLLPLVVVFILKGLNFIKSIKLENARERVIPLMAAMIFYFSLSHSFLNFDKIKDFHAVPAPLILQVLLLGSFWGIIALFMFNIFTKVSLHTAAAGSMVGIIIVMMMMPDIHTNLIMPLFIAIILAGIIGTSRMILGAHQKGDIWVGYITGILVQLGAYWFLK